MTWNALRTLVALLCGCTLGFGQTITNRLVVPRTAENTETPFGSGTLREMSLRVQQVYGSVEFPQRPMLIRELCFRPDAEFGGAFSATIATIRINLSTTQRNPSLLSSTFSENVGGDEINVFEGELSVSSQFAGPSTGPKAFDIVVPLSRPFLYDPGSGNLLIDIWNFLGSTASRVSGQIGPDSASRVIGNIGETTGTVDLGADAIQIVFSTGTNVPPRIVAQPQSSTAFEGLNVTFSVNAIGSPPLVYSWRKGIAVISGATNASLLLTNVQSLDAGSYSVAVSNAYGVAVSEAVTLTVVPRADHDLSLDFAIEAGNPNGVWSYGWQGTLGGPFNLFTFSMISQDPFGTPAEVWEKPLDGPSVQHNNSTNTVVLDGGEGNFPPEATWFYPGAEGYPENFGVIRFTVPGGGDGTYDVVAIVRPAYSPSLQRDTDFHVLKNGVELFGRALNASDTAGYTNNLALAAGDTVDFIIGRGADDDDIWSALKIEARLSQATTNPVPPTITAQPQNQTVFEGDDAALTVSANGSLPLSYQWFKGDAAIGGATGPVLTLSNVQLSQSGQYSVVLSNAYGVVTSQPAMLTVLAAPENAAIVPRTAANTESAYASGTLRDRGLRTQLVYGSIEFPQEPMLIEGLRFRPDVQFGRAFVTTISNVQINLSTTQRNPGSLSSTFSQNVGADDRIVFQGPLRVSSQFSGPTNGPKAFDITVPLSQPYLYNPAGGNLVIDIRNDSGSTGSTVGGQTGPDSAGRVVGSTIGATGAVDTGADAIQIVFSTTNAAPRLVSLSLSSPGGLAFAFQSTGNGNYVVEASTNLLNWTLVTNVVGASGLVEIVDPQPGVRPQRFYRARTP